MIAIDLNAWEPWDSIKTQFKPIESQQSGRETESLMVALEISKTQEDTITSAVIVLLYFSKRLFLITFGDQF